MNKKRLLIISLIIIIVVSIITNIYILTKDNNNDNTDSKPKYLQEMTYQGLKITNASIEQGDDLSSYKSLVSNSTTDTIEIDKLYIIFYIKEEETKLLALSNIKLQPNESTVIEILTEDDLNQLTDISFVLE